jgi:protein SCO1/2
MNRRIGHLPLILLATIMLAAGGMRAMADPEIPDTNADGQPNSAYAGLNEMLDAQLPLDTHFTDDAGQDVTLGKYFNTGSGRPIVLQLGYFECPMLCSQVSRGLLNAAKQMDLKAGKDFDFVFASINPAEDWRLAGLKRQSYLADYGRADTAQGFHFLVGDQGAIREITSLVGYHYSQGMLPGEYNTPPVAAFAHPAVLVIITPEGKVSRYLYGISFDPRTLQLSLDEASHNKIGTLTDHIELIVCCYNATLGGYALVAMRVMKLSAVVTMLGVGGTLFWLFRRDFARKTLT